MFFHDFGKNYLHFFTKYGIFCRMKRSITNELIAWKNKKSRHPLIIKGVRQVGKTYTIKEFGQKYFSDYHYINFEEDEKVGKIDFLPMYPMSFREFLLGIEENRSYDYLENCKLDTNVPEIVHTRLWEFLKIYFITGGLPEVVRLYNENKHDLYKALQLVRDKQNILILGYEADMAKHSGKQNSMHINRLWRNIPQQLAKEQNGSAPKFKFKDVIPGIKGYERLAGIIDWLGTAGLINKDLYH